MSEMTAFEQGYHAAAAGWRRSLNPYTTGTKGRRDWLKGWNAYCVEREHNASL